jgi:diguanylate cyclase (GGDEF)-like protein
VHKPEGCVPQTVETSKRLTIGVLLGFHVYEGSHPAAFAFPLIRGIQAAARDKNYNLLVACGVAQRTNVVQQKPAWPELGQEGDFVPVGPWNTDGLIFIGSLGSGSSSQYARRLIDGGFPALIIGSDAGSPAIIVDNEVSMRQVMEHLVGHGHRSIAFIAGDKEDLGDSTARVKAYRNGVGEFGLSDDPRLVEYGHSWGDGGRDAMERILKSGVKFTAVMCNNDLSAIGVIQALREAGVHVPTDVAVTGFDDILESQAQVPPLTSVHYPLFETGYRAILLLEKRIEHGAGAVPEFSLVSTRLVPRQSCGCLPEIVSQSIHGARHSASPADPTPASSKNELTQTMLDALLAEKPHSQSSELYPFCEQLADGFLRSLEDGDFHPFQNAMTAILQGVEMMSDDSAHVWQAVITVLRQSAHTMLKAGDDPIRSRRAEDLLHQARTLVSESADRRHTRLQVSWTGFDDNMSNLTSRLISSSDEAQVYDALREDLPQVGLQTCHVAFFEKKDADPVAVSLLHPLEKEAPVLRFETRQFPPPGLYPEEEPYNLVLLPMFFQEERMGYVAFDGGNLDPLATLVRQLSSSFKNVELHAKVLDLSLTDGLTGVHNRRYFEIMLQKETERSQRYKRKLVVIMIDIDHFKKYNDSFGHPAGDRALRELAQNIAQGARRGLDVISRYGGEEFALILPETDLEGARLVGENVRQKIADSRQFLQPTTISVGIAFMQGEQKTPPTLLEWADRALYQAKRQGRNRTVVFEDWMLQSAHTSQLE